MKKKGWIVTLIVILFISLSAIKGFKSFATYKSALNFNVYNSFTEIMAHSDGIAYFTKELLEGEGTNFKAIKFRSNYDEVLQDIQKLNLSIGYFKESTIIDTKKFSNIYKTIDINALEQRNTFVISLEENKALEEINSIFSEISSVIYENIKDLENDSRNNPLILKDDAWINIIEDINQRLNQ